MATKELLVALQKERRKWKVPCGDRNFIPRHRLNDILTDDAITRALHDCQIRNSEIPFTKNRILNGGRKTFAILILIQLGGNEFCAFANEVQNSHSELDAKLPLTIDDAQKFFEVKADDFLLRQWELIAPTFSMKIGHLNIAGGEILPFLSEKRFDECKEGSFGAMYVVELPSSHVTDLPENTPEMISLVRKEIRSTASKQNEVEVVEATESSSEKAFQRELEMLRYLQDLQHPSILPMLGSFTKGKSHSFLFPQKSGNLENVLCGQLQTDLLTRDKDAFQALSQLSSAVEKLQNFTSELFQVELIGCHRDLKPDNILVDDNGFYLADFGLSVLRERSLGSATSYNQAGGFYRAPECLQVDLSRPKGIMNRKSDIWSFGCILAEVLTFLERGPTGIADFKKQRWVRLHGCLDTYVFYGNDSAKVSAVETWLRNLSIVPGSGRAGLRELIMDMLNVIPDERPGAITVTIRLRKLYVECQIEEVTDRLKKLPPSSKDGELYMESERLVLILEAIHKSLSISISEPLKEELAAVIFKKSGIEQVVQKFDAVERELLRQETKISVEENSLIPQQLRLLCFLLRSAIDVLLEGASEKVLADLQRDVEIRCLAPGDSEFLSKFSQAFHHSHKHHIFGQLAAAKLVTMSLPKVVEEIGTKLQLLKSDLSNPDKMDNIDVATLSGHLVIVEHKKIEASWTEEYGDRLLRRVINLAEGLKKGPLPEAVALSCIGFYYENRSLSFGLVFALPRTDGGAALRPYRFISALNAKSSKPLLEARFGLAHKLAHSIAQLHKANWLHKNISSSTVVLLQSTPIRGKNDDQSENAVIDYHHAFLVGFNHSRLEEDTQWSEGNTIDRALIAYQHPKYVKDSIGFRLEYDYYSFGIVLLEIGLWQSLENVLNKLKKIGILRNEPTAEEIAKTLVSEVIPSVSINMGSGYAGMVKFCLEDIHRQSEGATQAGLDATSAQLRFSRSVVQRLETCVLALGVATRS